MRRRTAHQLLAISIALSTVAGARSQEPRPLLISRSDWVRFEIVMGRLTAQSVRGGHGNHHAECEDGTRETISQTYNGGTTSLTYEMVDRRRQLVLEVSEQRRIRIVHRSLEAQAPWEVEFEQPASGPVQFSILEGDRKPWRCSAPSLWHLMLAEPERCRRELVPILESIRSNWGLEEQARRTCDLLLDSGSRWAVPGAAELDRLVQQLSDASFAVRQGADRQLRGCGYPVLSYLDGLPRDTLDAEQRVRLDQIRAALRPTESDTPGRVASWLANDKSVWLLFLADADPVRRIVAVEQLGRLCGRQIAFDPQASDEQRTGQLARVRAELANLER